MKRIAILLSFLFIQTVQGQSFENFLAHLQYVGYSYWQAEIDSFMLNIGQTPLIENDSTVYFVYQDFDSAFVINLLGSHNQMGNTGTSERVLTRLHTTNLYYRKEIFEPNARIEYSFGKHDFVNSFVDPYNPNFALGTPYSLNVLYMPHYIPPWEVIKYSNVPSGILEQRIIYSNILQSNYTMQVYLPANYSNALLYPTVYFQNGDIFIDHTNILNVIDNLLDSGLIPPFISVFIYPNNGFMDYGHPMRDQYTKFVALELVPSIDSIYSTLQNHLYRAALGPSVGGTASIHMVYDYSNIFHNIGLLSPHIYTLQNTFDIIDSTGFSNINFSMIWGNYGNHVDNECTRIKELLDSFNYPNTYFNKHPQGNSWGYWDTSIDEILMNLFLAGTAINEQDKQKDLTFVFPNPAQEFISISMAQTQDNTQFEIYDLLGNLLLESQNWNSESIDVHSLASGVYILQILGDNYKQSLKFVKE